MCESDAIISFVFTKSFYQMTLGTYFFFILLNIVQSEQIICFTTASSTYTYGCYTSNTISNVDSTTNIQEQIENHITSSETDISLIFSGEIEYKFAISIFNSKTLTIQLENSASTNIDVSNINNVDITIKPSSSYTSTNYQTKITGSSLKDPQTSLTLQNIDLTSDFSEVQLKSFSVTKSTYQFTKFSVNSFTYEDSSYKEITINDNNIILDDKTLEFTSNDVNLILTLNSLTLNNQITTNSFISSVSLNSKTITFNGNNFADSISLILANCQEITTNVEVLPAESITSTSSLKITAHKSLNIKGSISTNNELTLTTAESQPSSRVSIKIGKVSVTGSSSYSTKGIQFLSSWIDLTVTTFEFNINKIPIVPCVGSGGSSTMLANEVTYGGSSSLESSSLTIKIDVTGEQTDETLATLMSQEWNAVTFKSFKSFAAVEKFTSITYDPSTINGFNSEASILSVRSTVSDDYTITFKASSYKDIPLILCYQYSSCKGTSIDDISKLAESIPSYAKEIKLYLGTSVEKIDLSQVTTTGATFSFVKGSFSSSSINSLITSEAAENANIEHLIFNNIYFGSGEFQLNSKEITFESISVYSGSPTIFFNEQSTVNIDKSSLSSIISFVTGSFPFTTVKGLEDTSASEDDSFKITDENYIFKLSYSEEKYSRAKLPNVVFHIDIQAYNNYALDFIVPEPLTIDSVTLKFETTTSFNYPIQVDFQGLDNITSANKLGIDFGTFTQENIINLNHFPMQDYYTFTGENVNVINEGVDSNRNLCACEGDGCSACDEDMTKVSYADLPQKIQSSSETLKVTVVGSADGSSPVVSLGILDNKDVTISGKGTEPKIQLDCSTQYASEGTELYFSDITIAYSAGTEFQVTNLIFIQNVKVDSSFSDIPLVVQSLNCDVSNLGFKTILVKKSLEMTGDPTNSQLSTKVTFSESSSFTFVLPNTITINGPSLKFGNLEFDLSNVNPEFSLPEEFTEFSIIGDNANIDTIGADITLQCTNKLSSVHISGTFANDNPSKFISFKQFQSDVHLQSENAPVSIEYSTYNVRSIILEKEKVGIAGKIKLYTGFSTEGYKIQSSLTEMVTFTVSDLAAESSFSTTSINFESSNIEMIINKISSGGDSMKFNLLLGLEDQNTINVVDQYDNSKLFYYTVTCTVAGYLSNPKIKEFIKKNHTMITVNDQNTIRTSGDLYFDKINPPPGFDNDNFKLIVEENTLIFYTFKSPIEGDLDLRYGSCSSCTETELSDEEIANLDHIILVENSNVTITFYAEIPSNLCLDFDKSTVSVQNLILKVSGSSTYNVPVKFGSAVTNINADRVVLNIPEDHSFSIQNVTLTNNAAFGKPTNYANVNSLSIDQTSIFSSGVTEFSKFLNISIYSSSISPYNIDYTATGIKISQNQNSFDIDVSKFPDATLWIPANSVPVFNLNEGVTELKEVNSLVFVSSSIQIGKNWNHLPSSTKVHYTLADPESSITLTTESFPFGSWDLMYNYKFSFASSLSPYIFSDKLDLNGQSITFTLPSSYLSTSNVVFEDVVLSGDAKIESVKDGYGDGQLIINKLLVQNGSPNVINTMIADELTLEPGSSLNNNFKLNGSLVLNIQWNLNQIPTLNSISAQSSAPQEINIIYKGQSIEGNEKEFDDFLSGGIVIMNNVNFDISDNVHFISENTKEFNSGDDLVLKCQLDNNEIKLIPTRSLIGGGGDDDKTSSGTESSPDESSPEEPPLSDESSQEEPSLSDESSQEETSISDESSLEDLSISDESSLEESLSPDESSVIESVPDKIPSSDSDTLESIPEDFTESKSSPEEPTVAPTLPPPPSEFEPTVGTTESDTKFIEFTTDGYKDSDSNFIPTKDKSDINLVAMSSTAITVSASYTGKPNSELFVSPKAPETTISIAPPPEGKTDYGTGQFGVHANSQNPTIVLPQSQVPLNIFNNMKSDTTLAMGQSAKLLDTPSTLSLEKLTVSKGELNIHVPQHVNKVEFEEVETYLNSKFTCLNGQSSIETSIEDLEVNPRSHIVLSDVRITKKIETRENSKIEVTVKARFSEETTKIELADTSSIEFGNAAIEGVCKELKVTESSSLYKLGKDEHDDDDDEDDDDHNYYYDDDEKEVSKSVICGANFDCESWANKFEKGSVYKYAKCVKREDGEMCLVATNKEDDGDDDKKKKKLSTGAIVGIVVAAVAVVAAVVVVTVIICIRRNPTPVNDMYIADSSVNDLDDNIISM